MKIAPFAFSLVIELAEICALCGKTICFFTEKRMTHTGLV